MNIPKQFYRTLSFALVLVAEVSAGVLRAQNTQAEQPIEVFRVRASSLDENYREYPEIDFVFGTDDKPADWQHASAPVADKATDELVIWLMIYKAAPVSAAQRLRAARDPAALRESLVLESLSRSSGRRERPGKRSVGGGDRT